MNAALFLALLQAIACRGDNTLGNRNTNPTAEITSPTAGAELPDSYLFTMRGVVADLETRGDLLQVTWYVNNEVACEETAAETTGVTQCAFPAPLGEIAVALSVRDESTGTATATVLYTGVPSQAPVATILTPDPSRRFYNNVPVALTGLVSDGEDDAVDLRAEWSSDVAGSLEAEVVPNADGEVAAAKLLTQGEHTLTLSVTDTVGKTGTDTVAITVGGPNRAPTCAIMGPAAGAFLDATGSAELRAQVADEDEGPTGLTLAWTSDVDGAMGTSTAATDGSSVFPWLSASSAEHVVTLTVTDEVGATCTAQRTWTTHRPPTVRITAPVTNAVFNEDETIALHGEVSDDLGPPEDLVVVWASDLDGPLANTPADSSGLTSYTPDALSVGTHELRLSATDDEGLTGSATVRVRVNGLPSAPTIQVTPSAPTTANDLVASVVTPSDDPEGDTVTYTWAWTKVGATGATSTVPTLRATATAYGEEWEVRATPSDGRGTGPAGVARVTIRNTPPTVESVSIQPEFPGVADEFVCVAEGADVDGQNVTFTYRWKVNGVDTGVTGERVTGLSTTRGDTVACVAIPNDGVAAGASAEASASVVNTPPTVTVRLSPSAPSSHEDVTCVPTPTDPDGDTVLFTYAWKVNGVTAAVTAATLPASWYQNGDAVECTVTPRDGLANGPTGSANLVVGNGAPSLASVELNNYLPLPTQGLTATPVGFTDPDGDDPGEHLYEWFKRFGSSGAWGPVGTNSPSLADTFIGKGDQVYVRVTPRDEFGAEGAPVSSNIAFVRISWSSLSAGDRSTCGLQPDGSLWCWGYNAWGQLGHGDQLTRLARTRVEEPFLWKSVSTRGASGAHTCGVAEDGSLWCWGYNNAGQLGVGDLSPRTSPTRVGDADDWATVVVSGAHSCALKEDQSAWCWGYNNGGQLGIGNSASTSAPLQVGNRTDWVRLTVGESHTCGITEDGNAYCWGIGNQGRLGNGQTTHRNVPDAVGSHSGWVDIGAGSTHTCGLKGDGQLWCWGQGANGRLGNDGTADSASPVRVPGDWNAIGVGAAHACAVRDDGGLWCWGANGGNQLGDGTANQKHAPVRVGSGDDWISVAGGTSHTCALRGDNDLWCWGTNSNGALGLGNTVSHSVPVEVEIQ